MVDARMTPLRAKILAALRDAGNPMSPLDIAQATGIKPENVRMILLRMRVDKQIEHAAYGQWSTAHGA